MGTLYNGGSAVYDISDLVAGTLYYVRVSAVSSVGTSNTTLAANNPVAPSQHPDAPADMAAEAVIGSGVVNSEIEVSFRNTAMTGDAETTHYLPHKHSQCFLVLGRKQREETVVLRTS